MKVGTGWESPMSSGSAVTGLGADRGLGALRTGVVRVRAIGWARPAATAMGFRGIGFAKAAATGASLGSGSGFGFGTFGGLAAFAGFNSGFGSGLADFADCAFAVPAGLTSGFGFGAGFAAALTDGVELSQLDELDKPSGDRR